MLQVSLHLVIKSKILDIFPCRLIFHIWLSIFRITGSPEFLQEFIEQTVAQTKCLGILYKGSASYLQLNTSSFILFQIHEFKDTKHSAVDKHKLSHTHTHKQAQIQYFAFSHTFTYTVSHTHTQYTHTKTSNVSELF